MSHNYLTETDAIKSWVLRACGWKVRDIQTRFDVDPRRLYEVWEEVEHKGTRFQAIRVFVRMFPSHKSTGLFEKHVPKYRRAQLGVEAQQRLPGF